MPQTIPLSEEEGLSPFDPAIPPPTTAEIIALAKLNMHFPDAIDPKESPSTDSQS